MLLGKGLTPNPFTPSLGVWFYVKILESEVEIEPEKLGLMDKITLAT